MSNKGVKLNRACSFLVGKKKVGVMSARSRICTEATSQDEIEKLGKEPRARGSNHLSSSPINATFSSLHLALLVIGLFLLGYVVWQNETWWDKSGHRACLHQTIEIVYQLLGW